MDAFSVPYGSDNPVFYDNDDHRDVYTDEFLLALSSAGKIDLKGISTTYSANQEEYELFVEGRENIVELAASSDMSALPPTFVGPDESLQEPSSGVIGDTEPIGTEATDGLIEAAKEATPQNPLVVITGGPLTVVADAYLHESSITESVIVASLLGTLQDTSMHNGQLDSWATHIVTRKFEYVQFPTGLWAPTVQKHDLQRRLPSSPLAEWMLDKSHPSNHLPGGADHDGQPAIPLTSNTYVEGVINCSVAAWKNGINYFGDDPDGNISLVIRADGHSSGQKAFFDALCDPAAYHS